MHWQPDREQRGLAALLCTAVPSVLCCVHRALCIAQSVRRGTAHCAMCSGPVRCVLHSTVHCVPCSVPTVHVHCRALS